MKTPVSFRQGDVLLVQIDEIPDHARALPRDEHGRVVLAHGEVTGHAHALRKGEFCSYSTLPDGDVEFLDIGAGGSPLAHELISGAKAEHDIIPLPQAKYELPVQVEYSPAELVRVSD